MEPPMEPERWREVRAEVERYLALPDAEREAARAALSREARRLVESEGADELDALIRGVRRRLPS